MFKQLSYNPTLIFAEGNYYLYATGDIMHISYIYKNKNKTNRMKKIYNIRYNYIEDIFPTMKGKYIHRRIDQLELLASVWSHYITHRTIG